jgi:hypothetical protein
MVKIIVLSVLFYFVFRFFWGVWKFLRMVRVEKVNFDSGAARPGYTAREKDISDRVKIISEKSPEETENQ